jgi:hypothetical protein
VIDQCGADGPLPTKQIHPRAIYHNESDIAELKRRLTRCRDANKMLLEQLACYRELAPGWLYSPRHKMLVEVLEYDRTG